MKNNNTFREHEIRIKNGYKPNYKQGMIAIRFVGNEIKGNKYKNVDSDGNLIINYQELFSTIDEEYVKYFEDKYNIKMSDYRSGSDDFYYYFTCEIGKEKEKLEEIVKDKIIEVVDFVDIKGIENKQELGNIYFQFIGLFEDYGEVSDKEIESNIRNIIKKLENLL